MSLSDPYFISDYAVIHFSGGRTSAYMLKKILERHGWKLPPYVVVVFTNTGKEREETLKFIKRCGKEWGVEIVWLEARIGTEPGFEVISFEAAARNGEPFEALIRDRGYLPNPTMRFCTEKLKIDISKRYVQMLGWEEWDSVIGLRADEPDRVAKSRKRRTAKHEEILPLADAGIGKHHVMEFWAKQPFDLELSQIEGNCDLCFLKHPAKIQSILQNDLSRAVWWMKQEDYVTEMLRAGIKTPRGEDIKPDGNRFTLDKPTYKQFHAFITNQNEMDFSGEQYEVQDCFCNAD